MIILTVVEEEDKPFLYVWEKHSDKDLEKDWWVLYFQNLILFDPSQM